MSRTVACTPDRPDPRLRSREGRQVLVEALVNFILPFVIYNYAEARFGEVQALLLSSVPPILWSVVEFFAAPPARRAVGDGGGRHRAVAAGDGRRRRSAFPAAAREARHGVIGLAFLGSALIGKPLIYELARASMRRKSEGEAQEFEALQVHAGFRRTMTVMTLVWGPGLLADVAVSVVLVFALSIREYLIVNPILGYGTMGAIEPVVVSLRPARQAPRRGAARGGRRACPTGARLIERFRRY